MYLESLNKIKTARDHSLIIYSPKYATASIK